jgi:hypothetical protein
LKPALPFRKWFESGHNPMRGASNVALHFAADSLKAAFEAGERYNESLHEKRGSVKASDLENPFQ